MKKRFLHLLFPLLLAGLLISCSDKSTSMASAEDINDIYGLSRKKVAVLSGSIDDLLLSSLTPAVQVIRLSSEAESMVAVESGQADYMMVDSTALIGARLEEHGLKLLFSTEVGGGDYGFGFRPDDKMLCDEVNAFMARCKADGRWDELLGRWTQGHVSEVVMQHKLLNPDGETLRIGIIPFFPFDFMQNGQYAGFEVEFWELFAEETGRNIEILSIDFSGLIAALISGKIDIISAALFITEERSKQILFSDPYFHCSSACICRDSQATSIHKSFFTNIKDSFHNNLIVEDRWKLIAEGLWETIVISLLSILLGSLFGGLVCLMRMSRQRVVSGIAKVYVEIIRGIPILVLLMLMFYVIFAATSMSPRWVAIIAFALNFGAYVSEMYRTGIESVDRGQTEAGLALGFSSLGTFIHFILPQAAKRVLPVFKGEAVSLFKNTSVVGFIAIQDLTKASEIIRARTFDAFFPLIIISILYFLLAWLFGKALDALAKKI